ncbi:MAG: DUF2933 domain-containing protein [Acidimicrobiales bacterium]
MCLNRKVLVSLALVGVGIYLFAPGLIGAAVPLLVVLACPLSMVFMMRGMSGGSRCETGTETTQADASLGQQQAGELARLRAEVDQLRAELSDRQSAVDDR